MVQDQNRNPLHRCIHREAGAWGVTVWFGGGNGLATNVRRYFYKTRKQARDGDISDTVGKRGRVR